MANTKTRDEIQALIYERGEISSDYVSNADMVIWINDSVKRLYALLADTNPDLYVTSTTYTIVSGTDTYALPADFYKSLGVDYVISANESIVLRPYKFSERNKFHNNSLNGGHYATAKTTRYRLLAGNIVFTPEPDWAGTVKHYYLATAPTLPLGSSTFDGICGFEEWIVLDCLVKYCRKAEDDSSGWEKDRFILEKSFKAQIHERDEGESPDGIRDMEQERNPSDGWF